METRDKLDSLLRNLLSVEHENIAYRLKFIRKQPRKLRYEILLEALALMDQLSRNDDDNSKKTIVTLCGIIWAYKEEGWTGLKDHIVTLLSRIGFAPSATMVDDGYDRVTNTMSSLGSLFSEVTVALDQLKYEVVVQEKRYLLTRFQYGIWQKMEEHKVLGVSAPTSAGKSFVILLKTIDLLQKKPGAIVYIVPTLSLVTQVANDFRGVLREFSMNDYEIHTSYNNQSKNYKIVYVLTQEKAIAAFAQTDNPFPHVRALIVDEIQNVERVADENDQRAKTLYDSLIDFRYSSSPDVVVISGPRIEKISLLGFEIFGEHSSEEESKSSPVINFTYSISKSNNKYFWNLYCDLLNQPLSVCIDNIDCIPGYGGSIYNQKFHDFVSTIVLNLGDGSKNIVFSPNPDQSRKTALAVAGKLPKKDDAELCSLISYISSTVRQNYNLCTTLSKGVAYHHGQLPHHVRRVLEVAITDKLIDNVVCTTTLMQGVNLPAQNVIIRNPKLYVKKRVGDPRLTHYEIANLRGRAGRLLKDFIGRAFVLDEDAFDTGNDEQKELFEDKTKELHPGYGGKFREYESEIRYALKNDDVPTVDNSEYSFLLTYVRQALLRHGEGAIQRLTTVGIDLDLMFIKGLSDSLSKLVVPKEVCFTNRYWDPLDLDKLCRQKMYLPMPLGVGEDRIAYKLKDLILYLKNSFPVYYDRYFRVKDIPGKDMLIGACIKAEQWAKEKPLSSILANQYYDDPLNIDSAISLLQNKISYGLPMLLKPIYDICHPQSMFLRFIESGGYQPCTRRLVELNIPRETAIYLNEKLFKKITQYPEDIDSIIISSLRQSYSGLDYWVKAQLFSIV